MRAKHAPILGIVFALFAMLAVPAQAQSWWLGANATVVCSGKSTISLTASGLPIGDTYTLGYTVVLTPSSGPAIQVANLITFTASSTTQTVTQTIPLNSLPGGTYSLSGAAALWQGSNDNGAPLTVATINFTNNPLTCPSAPPPPMCSANSSNASNFNGTAIRGGDYIWFNANFTASGVPSSGTTITFTNSTISFTANGQNYHLAVPNSSITFTSSVSCATVTFDTVNQVWNVSLPINGSDEIFLSGLAFPVPAGGLPGGIHNVTWTGTSGTNTSGLNFQWKWGAAVYTNFTTAYNSLDVKPTHQNACSYNNGDHAGTPENSTYQSFVVGGAAGGGGSNFTGSWSGTNSVTPICTSSSIKSSIGPDQLLAWLH